MIGAIAGDIIGSRFEGERSPPPDFELFDAACRFTDDTVCTVAVADALLGRDDFAAVLRAYVRRHPRRGYGKMFLRWALDEGAPAYGSWGNGAPMRVAAVGWLASTEDEIDEWAAAQAAVSHDHPDAVAASRAVARAIFALRSGEPPETVARALAARHGYDLRREAALVGGRFDVSAAGTAQSALAAALGAPDWESAVRTAVGLGGDTDTLASIAGAIAEAIHGVPEPVSRRARAYLTADLAQVLERFECAVGRAR